MDTENVGVAVLYKEVSLACFCMSRRWQCDSVRVEQQSVPSVLCIFILTQMVVFCILAKIGKKKQYSDWEKHLILCYSQNKK